MHVLTEEELLRPRNKVKFTGKLNLGEPNWFKELNIDESNRLEELNIDESNRFEGDSSEAGLIEAAVHFQFHIHIHIHIHCYK